MLRRFSAWVLPLVAALVWGALPAAAEDQPFVTLYSTDIHERGEAEFEQWLHWKTGHTGATYDEFLARSEVEYGLLDDLQGSLYLSYDHSRTREPGGPADTDSFVGVQGELIYRLLNVHSDPLGLALYVEPSYSAEEHGIETKILLQKNFLHDALRWVVNVNFEDNWDRDQGGWNKVSALEFDTGLAYRFTPELSGGVEFDNERAFNGLVLGGTASQQSSAYYLGPTIHYEGEPFDVTLGAQAQLPMSGAGALNDGFVADAERYRIILRISCDL